LAVKSVANLWLAGQLSGVEGYLESAAGGLAAAFAVDRAVRGQVPRPFPPETVLGALLHYLAHASIKDFGPTNAMLGLLPPLPDGALDLRSLKRTGGTRAVRAGKGELHRKRSLEALEAHLQATNQVR
jgi:methylenetetrahydrofolate--tRNA-(uracil-5-)-methyltransferase